ncbi:hypothetical protein ACIBF1_33210 [Spirillospora sp. NPDC050679]
MTGGVAGVVQVSVESSDSLTVGGIWSGSRAAAPPVTKARQVWAAMARAMRRYQAV